MSNVKKFDQALYNECDTLGKNVTKRFMADEGYELTSEVEAYKSHDLIFTKDGKECKVEVEINRRWTTRHYPARTMTVPFRKRFSKADLYIMVSKNGEALLTIPMANVLKADTIVKDTCFTKGERFFCLPISAVRLYYLEDSHYYAMDE